MLPSRRFRRLRPALAAVAALALAAGLSACGGGSEGGDGSGVKLSLVGYSVAKSVYDTVQPAFADTDEGAGVRWDSSYGASGDQSRAVVNGLPADYVAFSLEPDVTRLVDAGIVDPAWNTGPTKGMVSDSVVVFVVRKGNPKKIAGWDDVVQDGVKVVTPNPGSSGAAKWNIMGAYAHGLAQGGEAGARDFLTRFYGNVVSLPASGREATSAFTSGTGDVLISYENEAILARQSGQSIDYVVPDDSFLIENPAAVTKDAPPQAQAFLDFVLSVDGQKLFAQKGFRPVIDGVDPGRVDGANDEDDPFPVIRTLHTVAELGGWTAVNRTLFDAATGLVPQIQKQKGLG